MDRDEMLCRLADDLEQVKSAVARSATVLREVAGPSHYRGLLWYLGTAIVALALLFHFVPLVYGGFGEIPEWLRAVLFAAAFAVIAFGAIVKLLTVGRVARSVDRRMTLYSFFRHYYAPMVAHLYPPLVLIAIGVCAWLLATGRGFFVVGTLGLFSGILLNLMGATFRRAEYLVFGYWMLAAGAASLLVPGLSTALWVAAVFGGGCLAFATATTVLARPR